MRKRQLILAPFILFLLAGTIRSESPFMPPAGGDWRTFATEHFRFYYRPACKWAAERLAPQAEAIYDRLVAELKMPPAQQTHVVIYDRTDEYNGLASVIPRNLIVLFAANEYAGGYGRTGDTMLETFTHEYTHILHMGYVKDTPQAINSVIGRVLMPNTLLPPWCTEGLAVAMESELFPSGRLHSSTWRMYLRADVLAGQELTWPQVSNGIYRWPYGNAWYLYGSHFTEYLIKTHGRDRVMEFYQETAGDLPYFSFTHSFAKVFGVEFQEALAAWRQWAAAAFTAEKDRITAKGLREGRSVASYGGRSGQGVFAPDGRLFFMRRSYDTPARMMTASPPYDKPVISAALPADKAACSPDGRRLAFGLVSQRGGNMFSDLYLYDLKRGRTERLSTGLRAADPAWSPDGRRLACIINSPPNYSLYCFDLEQRAAIPIWKASGQEQAFMPAWSPRGDRIAFARYRPEDGLRLWLIDPDGGALTPVHDGPSLGEEMDPAWSPDGKCLFFAADPDGVFNIYAYEFSTATLWQVTNVLTGAFAPAVSPDGKTLAYTGYSPSGYDQYVMAIDRADWLPRPLSGMAETGSPPPSGDFYIPVAPPPEQIQDESYSPWSTLQPAMGYLWAEYTTDGQYEVQLALAGLDVLQTFSYVVQINQDDLGVGYDLQADWRLRPFTIGLHSTLGYGLNAMDQPRRKDYNQLSLSGEGNSLLWPNDRLSWTLAGFYERDEVTDPGGASYLGGELGLAYNRSRLYRGPVDLAEGFGLGCTAGVEKRLETGDETAWTHAWGRVYLPLADKCRLELTAGMAWNSSGLAGVDLGLPWMPAPTGELIWQAEAMLEFPLAQPESGGIASPLYLHAVNGVIVLHGGEVLVPAGEAPVYSVGAGFDLRLQTGYTIPFDLYLLLLQPSTDQQFYFGIWYRMEI